MSFLVILAVLYAFYRRLILKPARLKKSKEALLILSLIFMIMFTASIFYDAENRGDTWILALRLDQLKDKIKRNRKKLNKSVWSLDKEA